MGWRLGRRSDNVRRWGSAGGSSFFFFRKTGDPSPFFMNSDYWPVAGGQDFQGRKRERWESGLGDGTPQPAASVARKGRKRSRPNRAKTGVILFMGFPTILTAGEESKTMGRKRRGRGRKFGALPELRWPLRPSIFGEHEKRLPRLLRRKGEESARRSSVEAREGGKSLIYRES